MYLSIYYIYIYTQIYIYIYIYACIAASGFRACGDAIASGLTVMSYNYGWLPVKMIMFILTGFYYNKYVHCIQTGTQMGSCSWQGLGLQVTRRGNRSHA